jgi:hypothetical protein
MEAILNKKITTEFEGKLTKIKVGDVIDFLINTYEISNNSKAFVRNAVHGLTDTTFDMSEKDKKVLSELYYELWCSRY